MSYTVLARRYRSQTFDDVVGQDAVAQTMKNAINSGRVAHAYLLCGTRGVGKTTMARILAKSLNCLESDEPTTTPCLKCDSCVSVNAGEDIDVIEIDGASNTGVDNIRQLRQNAMYRPARARFKIYIIDEVHMLSNGAFNALLKILEEPPEHVKFIFATTEPNKVLATIQSRCQRFDFSNIGPDVIGKQLRSILNDEGVTYEDEMIIYLSRLANGSMRDALSLLDQLISTGSQPLTLGQLTDLMGEPDREKMSHLLEAIGTSNAAGVIAAVETLLQTGQSPGQICDSMIEAMRDMMVLQATGGKGQVLILTEQEKARLTEVNRYFDMASIIYNITALEKLRWTIRNSDTGRALVEASLLRLALKEHFIGLDKLVGQLQRAGGVGGAMTAGVKKNLTPDKRAGFFAAKNGSDPTTHDSAVQNSDSAGGDTQPAKVEVERVINGPVSIETIRQNWPAVMAQLQKQFGSLVGYMSNAMPMEFNNGVLTVGFVAGGQGQLQMRMCVNHQPELEKALSKAIGSELRIKFMQTQQAQSTVPKARIAGSKMTQQERDEVLNDPDVQMILQGLKATPLEIKKMDG